MEPLEPNLVCVHHATPEFHGSQIRPRQIILFDRLFHRMQKGLLFIFLGEAKGKLMANNYICGFLIGRGLLFISYLRQKKGRITYSQSTGKRRSAITAGCKRVIVQMFEHVCHDFAL